MMSKDKTVTYLVSFLFSLSINEIFKFQVGVYCFPITVCTFSSTVQNCPAYV